MAESGGNGGVLRELLAVFGFGIDDKELERGENRLDEFLGKVKDIAEKVAVAFAVDQIYEFAEGQARAMNAIERTGTQLGITTDRVQEFTFAAKSLGLEADSLLNLMGRLQITQQMAAQGGKDQAGAFHALGVSIKDSNGHMKAADELTLDVADGIAKISDPSKQAAIAVQLFGRQGREILPFLKEGRAGAEEYFKAFRENGGGYTEEALKAGKDFDKQQAKTNLALTSLKSTLAKALLPVVTQLSKGVQAAAKWFNELAAKSHIVQAALTALVAAGTAFAISMAIAFAPVILGTAAIAALVLVLDDLYTFLSGGDSEIGDILDRIFGKGAQTDILEQIKNTWEDIKNVFEDLGQKIRFAWMELQKFMDAADKAGVILRATLRGQNVGQALLEHEQQKTATENGPTQNQKDFYHRVEAIKRGRVFRAKGETQEQADLAANIIRTQQPGLSPEFGPLPYIPGVSPGGNGGVHVDHLEINQQPGQDGKQLAEDFMKHVNEARKQERRDAAATLPRAGN